MNKIRVLILLIVALPACATVKQEMRLRELEMAHAYQIAQLRASTPKPILYEATNSDGTHVVVYAPSDSVNVQSQYVSRPLPKADLSILYPFVSLVSAITGQYYGFRTSEAMYNFLGKQTPSSNSYYSTSDSSVHNTSSDTITKTRYGDYSGNGGAGSDSRITYKGNTVTNTTDSNKVNISDDSQHTYNYTEQTQVIPPVITTPVVITPVITGGGE